MELNNIVVGFDGSPHAEAAIDAVARIVPAAATVHVVTAFDPPSAREVATLLASVPDEFKSTIDPVAAPQTALRDAARACERLGLRCETHLVSDDPASAILDVAETTHADLICVGSRGVGATTRFLRGSVSSKVSNHARTNVLIIHGD